MNVDEKTVSTIVEQVLATLQGKSDRASGNGVFATLDDAVAAAEVAQRELMKLSLEARGKLIGAMRAAAVQNAQQFAVMANQETGLGRTADKVNKNILAATKTPGIEDLMPVAVTGDHGLTVTELAPWGVIGAITPMTNPTETVINNGICMISAGNSVVFNSHPKAMNATREAITVLNQAIVAAGGPPNLLNTVQEPTMATAQAMMKHPGIQMLVVTGGGGVVRAAMASGKKCIAAGPGNPPVVVDETAILEKAARDIVNGNSFDNNIVCALEKELFVVESVADPLKRLMLQAGAYEVRGRQADELLERVLTVEPGHVEGHPNAQFVGKDASVILDAIGIKAVSSVRSVLVELDPSHPLVMTEQMMPVIPFVRVRNVDEAIRMAIQAEKGNRHTAVMHSTSLPNLSRMASVINTSIFVKNGPSYAGLGFGGEGCTAWTIAGSTGEGCTTARTFTRPRRCVLVDYFRIV